MRSPRLVPIVLTATVLVCVGTACLALYQLIGFSVYTSPTIQIRYPRTWKLTVNPDMETVHLGDMEITEQAIGHLATLPPGTIQTFGNNDFFITNGATEKTSIRSLAYIKDGHAVLISYPVHSEKKLANSLKSLTIRTSDSSASPSHNHHVEN